MRAAGPAIPGDSAAGEGVPLPLRPALPPAVPVGLGLTVPSALSGNLARLADHLRRRYGLQVDPLALLSERAEVTGLHPPPDGQTSRNLACRLLRTGDGAWMALNLSRPWDLEALPAWTGGEPTGETAAEAWQAAGRAASTMTARAAVQRAQLLGVAAATSPGDWSDEQARSRRQSPPPRPWLVHRSAAGGRSTPPCPLVVDLSTLWAGPLAGRLLAEWGADVVKVEDPRRPDGLRSGGVPLYERLNTGKRQASLSLPEAIPLMTDADVILTSGRPRVWDQLGVPALRGTWVRITGYGGTGPWREWVAFGDDAAVAGGLVWPGEPPAFVADAVADPLTGLVAAAGALAGVSRGGGVVVDVAMREVAGWLAGPDSGDPGDSSG